MHPESLKSIEIASRKVRNLNPPARYAACIKAFLAGIMKKYGSCLYYSFRTDVVHRGNPNPNPFLYQTRAQRQRVAAEKEKQGHRSMWRCLCRHMTSWPCFDVVLQGGLARLRREASPFRDGRAGRGENVPPARFLTPLPSSPLGQKRSPPLGGGQMRTGRLHRGPTGGLARLRAGRSRL